MRRTPRPFPAIARIKASFSVRTPTSAPNRYRVESGEGERLLAGDQLFTFLSHQGHTNGAFIALMTAGPSGGPIPKHFHEQHTETFLCSTAE